MQKTLPVAELTKKEKAIIKQTGAIPYSVLTKRLDVCAKEEGLPGGHCSSDDEIRALLIKLKRYERHRTVSVQLMVYLQEKYSGYLFEGCRKNYSY
jgi:hypothetical protein